MIFVRSADTTEPGSTGPAGCGELLLIDADFHLAMINSF
jgi:hypothetical protein